MHDRLVVELEFIVAQRALQFLQPMDLARVPRVRLLSRGVHVHVDAALLLRDVAGGVGGIHDVLDRAAAAADLHQADADADVEDLVLPHEAVIVDRPHHVIGDLPRLLQRTSDQQQRELVAADAARGVGVAHRFLDDGGHLAQHVVARGVPAGIVHHLEPIEIEVAQRVGRIPGLRRIHRLAQPPLEFAPIDETGERVVARLIGHLPGQPAQLAGVVHDHHQPERLLGIRLERGDADLDGALGRRTRGHEHRTLAHGDAAAGGQRLANGIPERAPVGLVHERGDLRERLADDLIEASGRAAPRPRC